MAGKEEIKLGSLTPTRDFNYVKDTAAGFIAIAESDKTIGQEINIATQREISIGDLAKEIIAQINPDAKIVCDEQRLRPEKSEVNRLLGANAKIKELTDWKQQYTLNRGLQRRSHGSDRIWLHIRQIFIMCRNKDDVNGICVQD